MDRRKFLSSLLAGAVGVAAAAVIDPEELLWAPGKKAFSKPPVPKSPLANHYYGKISAYPGYAWQSRYLTVEDFQKNYIDPVIKTIADKIDADLIRTYQNIYDLPPTTITATEVQLRMNSLSSSIIEHVGVPKDMVVFTQRLGTLYCFGTLRSDFNPKSMGLIVGLGE